MVASENNELLIELWSRLKPYVSAKERLEAADAFVAVFDAYGLIDDTLLSEHLDRELRAAARTYLADPDEGIEEDDNDDGFGF